jgi:hypothetical protein
MKTTEQLKANNVDNKTHFRYCKKCGTKKEIVECAYFNEFTGEKEKDEVCARFGCEKRCDFYGHEWKRRWWFASDVKCIKCGYIPRDC